jgi:hypothetical protein
MNKTFTFLTLSFLLSSFLATAQQEIKESGSKEITKDTWVNFQDHNNVTFLGQLGDCNGREVLKLKVTNRNATPYDIRVGYVNGGKRLATSMLTLQPMQTIELSCTGIMGTTPVYLADGHSIRIESQVIKRN